MPLEHRIWSVFTKPWRELPAAQLAELVSRMGFNAIEFPLRPGFQVDLDHLKTSLGDLTRTMTNNGIGIASVASDTTPEVFEACAENGIPLIRIMINVSPNGYLATGDEVRRRLNSLASLAEQYGVMVGIQPHYDDYIADSSELATLLADCDPTWITAIWDAAHDGLARKHPANALAQLWDRLAMANFKNACYRHVPAAAADTVPWEIDFVEGADGLCSWVEAARYLTEHHYTGPICLPAEYSDERDLERRVTRDLAYLRAIMEGHAA